MELEEAALIEARGASEAISAQQRAERRVHEQWARMRELETETELQRTMLASKEDRVAALRVLLDQRRP